MSDARRIIETVRDGRVPTEGELRWFAIGLADGKVSDAQAGAFAMAVCLNGLGEEGRVALTAAMRDSGETLAWDLAGPVVDKHSTGGVGDCVSLVLAPILAAAGCFVPMVSGRGLGHTGGTLDKLEAIPGFRVDLSEDEFRAVVTDVGCAIVSASADLGPADRRLYAIRDVSGTVESVDLITASILSKKLAAGIGGLVLDVKCGDGAFMRTENEARTLAKALVETAKGAGCPTVALITSMDEPVADAVGNACEVRAAVQTMMGDSTGRLAQLSVALAGEALALAGMAASPELGAAEAQKILEDGRAMERFQRMVVAQGGPADLVTAPGLQMTANAKRLYAGADIIDGKPMWVSRIRTRKLAETVLGWGGGRRRDGDEIDHAVGVEALPRVGERHERGFLKGIVTTGLEGTERDLELMEFGDCVEWSFEPTEPVPLILGRVA